MGLIVATLAAVGSAPALAISHARPTAIGAHPAAARPHRAASAAGSSFSFTEHDYPLTSWTPGQIATGDLNGDRYTDVVVAQGQNGLTVLMNKGDGSGALLPPVDYPVGNITSVAIGDVNGDGIPDLVAASVNPNELLVMLGNGDGTFQSPLAPTATYGAPLSVALGDFNGDAKIDAAVGDLPPGADPARVEIYRGNGDGTFTPPANCNGALAGPSDCYPFDNTYGSGNYIHAVDLNGDGNLDVVVDNNGCGYNSGVIGVLLGNGDGTFQPAVRYLGGQCPGDPAIADFNGEGHLDLAPSTGVVLGAHATLSPLLGDGTGAFTAGPTTAFSQNIGNSAAADFDGDGVPDIAITSGGPVLVAAGNGGGTFGTAQSFGPTAGGIGYGNIAVADLTGNGKPDIIATCSRSIGNSCIVHNQSPGTTQDTGYVSVFLTNSSQTCGSASSITGITPSGGASAQATVQISQGVAAFVGPSNIQPGSYTAVINWGDGATSPGSIQTTSLFGQDLCLVLGRHTYARPGHYVTSVTLNAGALGATLAGTVFGVSPPSAPAPSAVGVLTSDNGPQCTATVVDLANSFDFTHPEVSRRINQYKGQFNGNVVVTAAHCVASGHGFMFAPGFIGIAPRFSVDFTSGYVSPDNGQYGSPFAGSPIGQAPLGVWGCSNDSRSTRQCGTFGPSDATVIVPKQASSDASYDYAFVVFHTAPQNQSGSLLQVAGGLPIWFDPRLTAGNQLHHPGYDINWFDANRPGNASGWFDLINPPEKIGSNCTTSSTLLEVCTYQYSPFASTAGPRTCSPSFDQFKNLGALARESRPSALASPCSLGNFSSGASFLIGPGNAIVGVTKTTVHAGPALDPTAKGCCTGIFTPLRFRDAFFAALNAELS